MESMYNCLLMIFNVKVIAYGMKEYGLNLHDTMKHVKSKRSVINPNPGFWKQLITYEGILNSR